MSVDTLINLRNKLADARKIIFAQIQLLYSCNFRCKHCYIEPNKSIEEKREISLEEWKNIILYLKKRGVVFLRITGGEPLISDYFPAIYEFAWDLDFKIAIATNGYYINRYKDLFAEKKPYSIAMSLYGLSERSYTEFCASKEDAWQKIQNNIFMLKEIGVRLQLNFMLNAINSTDLDTVESFRSNLNGTGFFCFRRVHCDTNGGANPLKYTASIDDIIKSYHCFNDYINPMREHLQDAWAGQQDMCYAGLTSCYISPFGELFFCNVYEKKKFSILTNGFESAWEKITSLRKDIDRKCKCVSCGNRDFCGTCYPSFIQLKQSGKLHEYCDNQRKIYQEIKKHIT